MLNIVLFSTAQKFSKLLYLKYLSNHSCDYCQRKMLPNTVQFLQLQITNAPRFCSCKQKSHRNANNSKSFHQFMPLCRVPSHFTRLNFSNRITTKIHNAKANTHCRIATEIVIVIMYLCRWGVGEVDEHCGISGTERFVVCRSFMRCSWWHSLPLSYRFSDFASGLEIFQLDALVYHCIWQPNNTKWQIESIQILENFPSQFSGSDATSTTITYLE